MKYRLNKSLLFIALLIITKCSEAQPDSLFPKVQPAVFSLSDILDSIDARNPGLQQFDYKAQASYARGEAARSWATPSAGIGLSEFHYSAASTMDANCSTSRKMLMLRLQQMFPNFSQQRKEQAFHRSYAQQYQDDRETMKNRLFAKAKLAYYDTYIAAKKIKVIGEQQKQLKLLIQIAEGRLAYGKARLANIYKARAKLSDLTSMKIKLQSMHDQAVAVLNSLMNLPIYASLQLDTTTAVMEQHADILQVDSSYIQKHRSDIQHIRDEIHSMRLKQEVVSAEKKPTFGLSFDNMRMPVRMEGKNSSMYMYNVMAMVSIPIAPWFSKGYKAEARSIDDQIHAMQKMQDGQVHEVIGNIRKDWLRLQSARKDLNIFQSQVIPAYGKVFQSNLNAFSENTGDIYETLSAWDELTMKKLTYYDKLETLLNIQVMLETEMQAY